MSKAKQLIPADYAALLAEVKERVRSAQYTALKVHVANFQVQGLAHPQTAAVEQTEHLGHNQMAQWRFPAGFDVVGHMKHPPYFGVSEDSGRETTVASFRHQVRVRNVGGVALVDHKDGEPAKRVAEREKVKVIFTIDRKDFGVYRPHRLGRFTLLP